MLKRIIDYFVNDLGIPINVAATIILTLLTFSFGFIITWTAAAVSKWNKRRNYRKSLKIIIRDFLNSCKKQYDGLDSFSNHKGFLHGEDYKIILKSNFGQSYLANLDVSIFIENFSSIFKKARATEISHIFEIVASVKNSKESFKEQMSFFYSKYDDWFQIYNDHLENLRKLHDDLVLEFNGTPLVQLNAHINSIFKTYSDWRNNGANTFINTTSTEIVNSLFENALEFPPSTLSRKVIDNCLSCRLAVSEIMNVENHMKEEINEVRDVHKRAFENGLPIINRW